MIKLTTSLENIDSPDFKKVLKEDIQNIEPTLLPLQQGLSFSSYVGKGSFNAVILKITDNTNNLRIKAGIFYTGIIAGCSCSDDPTPTDEQNEYCEIQFDINKETAETDVKLLDS